MTASSRDAVQIAIEALRMPRTVAPIDRTHVAQTVVAALVEAGLLVDPERLAALEAVADVAQRRRMATTGAARAALSQELFAALDALPAAKTPES